MPITLAKDLHSYYNTSKRNSPINTLKMFA
nr:MAG TPA: hypothetical protein [Caudoviricetes sp.]